MKGKLYEDLICAIDVGTTKICVLVAQEKIDGALEIIGFGKSLSDGLKKGIVVDIEKTICSIKKAVQEAELMAGCSIKSANIGISGSHVQSLTSHGIVPIKKSYVTHQDIKDVVDSAQAVPIAEDQQILHVLPQFYTIDSQDKVQNPLGLHGVRLEAQVHIITGSVSCAQNLIICCQRAGIYVNDIVLEHIASAMAVLSKDERQLGVSVIDIGGGTADIALYHNNSVLYTMVIPVAGNHFTNDLAMGLRLTIQNAERIKKEYGSVILSYDLQDVIVEDVQGGCTKRVSQEEMIAILHARAHELFSIINKNIQDKHLKSYMTAGLVLTGGGSSLKGLDQLASYICKLPVRVGIPHISHVIFESLTDPMYATGCGLLLYAQQREKNKKGMIHEGPILNRITQRMRSWVADFF